MSGLKEFRLIWESLDNVDNISMDIHESFPWNGDIESGHYQPNVFLVFHLSSKDVLKFYSLKCHTDLVTFFHARWSVLSVRRPPGCFKMRLIGSPRPPTPPPHAVLWPDPQLFRFTLFNSNGPSRGDHLCWIYLLSWEIVVRLSRWGSSGHSIPTLN